MNTDYYRVILKVIETGNISKTAQLLGYTQSGVSNIISKVEKQLEMKLFNRDHTGIRLAAEAQSLVPIIRNIVKEEDAFLKEVSNKINGQEVTIKIVTVHSFAVTILPQLLNDFQKQNPNVRFELKELNYYGLIEKALQEGESDFAFTVYSYNQQMEYHELFRDDYCVVMPKDHPLAGLDSVEPEQLAEYPFILPEEEVYNTEVKKIISSMKANKSLETKPLDDMMILSFVENGWGISIVPQQLTKLSNADIAVSKLGKDFYRPMGMIAKKNSKVSHQHRLFKEFVIKWFKGITN